MPRYHFVGSDSRPGTADFQEVLNRALDSIEDEGYAVNDVEGRLNPGILIYTVEEIPAKMAESLGLRYYDDL